MRLTVTPDVSLDTGETDAVASAGERLAAFLERPLDLVVGPSARGR